MGDPRTFVRRRPFLLTEMTNICRDQLQHAIKPVPGNETILESLESAGNALSRIAAICASVVEDMRFNERSPSPIEAVKEIQNVIEWTDFIAFMQAQSGDTHPDYLFRAHSHDGKEILTFNADLNTPFDLTFKCTFSVDTFAEFLNEHLNKTQEPADTCMISTSSNLGWTVHLTGQKSKRGRAGLAIFDVKRWCLIANHTIFRVRDVCKFLDTHGKGRLVSDDLRKWADNCDEYVSVGNIPQEALVRWVFWEDLFDSSVGFLQPNFLWSYTLGVFRQYSLVNIAFEVVCNNVVGFAKVLAGPEAGLLVPFIKSILKDGIEFWGYVTHSPRIEVERTAWALVEMDGLEEIASLSIS